MGHVFTLYRVTTESIKGFSAKCKIRKESWKMGQHKYKKVNNKCIKPLNSNE